MSEKDTQAITEDLNKTPSVSELLKQGWQIFTDNAITLTVLVVAPLIANIGFAYTLEQDTRDLIYGETTLTSWSEIPPSFWYWLAVVLVVGMISAAAVISTLVEIVGQKRKVDLSEAIRLGANNLGRLIIVGLLAGLIVIAGLIALIIPGIIAAFLLSFAMHAAVDNKDGATAALSSSYNLVKKSAGLVFLCFLAIWGVSFAFSIVLGVLSLGTSNSDLLPQLATNVMSAPVSAWASTVVTVLYFALKQRDPELNNTD